jgi:heptose I phosphotransferase
MEINCDPVKVIKFADIVVNEKFLFLLTQNGFSSHEAIYNFHGGTVIKKIPGRTVTRFKFQDQKNQTVFYLKRHKSDRPNKFSKFFNRVTGSGVSAGIGEFNSICDFRAKGIPAVVPVAAGERLVSECCLESFLITKDFSPFVSLEEIVQNSPERLVGANGLQFRRKLLTKIGQLAYRMHQSGLNHRDFNATHLIVSPEEADFSIALFDFQRVDRKHWLRYKWMIKTMGELFFSMPEHIFSVDDKILLYKTYHSNRSIGPIDKINLFLISRKTKRIGRHTAKIRKKICSTR